MKSLFTKLIKWIFKHPVYPISLIAVVFILSSGYLLTKYLRTQDQLKQLTEKTIDKTPEIINQVGKLIQLPADETPTVATITDKEKLKDQPFFTQAENGDNILIYLQAKKAIIYRPSINKIIDIAPVNTGTTDQTPKPSPTSKP